MRILLLSLSISLFLSMNASAASKSCPELKTQAVGKHHKCITLAQRGGRKGTERRLERCDWRLERNIQNAEKSFGCDGVLGAEEIDDVVNTFSDSIIEAASGRTGVPEIVASYRGATDHALACGECVCSKVRSSMHVAHSYQTQIWHDTKRVV